MQSIILGLYNTFSCMAGDCPATCCAGWKIVVDKEDYDRFRQLEHGAIRDDILSHLIERNGEYCFQNDSMGRCAMLDSDGLCRIQKSISEDALCNTCRKFPRLTAQVDGELWISMAASCPVVAKYLLTEKVRWHYTDEFHRELSIMDLPIWQDCEKVLEDCRLYVLKQDLDIDIFVDVAMDCLDVLLCFPQFPYLEDSFDYYQEEGNSLETMSAFRKVTKTDWNRFFQNYIHYRIPSRYLEYPSEPLQERIKQVLGELLLIRVILCSRYRMRNGLQKSDWMEVLQWVYRFCAHGQKMGQKVHRLFLKWKREVLCQAYMDDRI